MQWAPFSFNNPGAIQSTLYENKPDLPYQQFKNWFGQGQSGFENTVFGRWLGSQQDNMYNNFLTQQSANPTGNLTWTNYLEQQANQGGMNGPDMANQFRSLQPYMRGSNAGAMSIRRELW